MVLKNIILDIIFPVVSLILIGHKIVDGKISSIQSLEGASSIDGNFHDINEPSIEEDYHHINAASIDEGYPNINKASMEESYHNINAASIDQDYHDNLNSLSISLNDDQFEEKRPIDITKKLKDLGNRITSFFIGDNERSYEESSNYLTEAPVNSRADINKNINEEAVENRVSSQQNLSELTKKLTVPDGNSVEMRVDYNKNVNNDAEIKTGNTKFENHVTHDKYISPQDLRMNTNEIIRGNKNIEDHNKYTSHEDLRENINEIELQDAINAMPLLKQYLKIFAKTEPQVNHRTNLNPPLRPQHDLPGLKRIQGYLKTTNSQLMNSSLPGFRGDPQLLDTFGKKLKGFGYSRK